MSNIIYVLFQCSGEYDEYKEEMLIASKSEEFLETLRDSIQIFEKREDYTYKIDKVLFFR